MIAFRNRLNGLVFFLLLTLFPALAATSARAAVTGIAQLPLLNIDGTGNVKPNLMLLYDNSGSMASAFTPDYVDDAVTCRARGLMSGGTRGCTIGQPPFASADFNRQYYDPKVRYTPPVNADGTPFPSMTRGATTNWTKVATDGFGVNKRDLLGASTATTDLANGFPDLRWCDTGGANCVYNSVTYSYPNDTRFTPDVYLTNPYYWTIRVAEYCTDATLKDCVSTAVGAAAPPGYPEPAKVRWCDSTKLTNCRAKYVDNFKYPRFSNPNRGMVAAYGTIAIPATASTAPVTIRSVSVVEPGRTVAITDVAVTASLGSTPANRIRMATALAASINARTGLANQYAACVRTPDPANGGVPACGNYGIVLGSDYVVAVVPVVCPAGGTKSLGGCSTLTDAARANWPLNVDAVIATRAAQGATALINVSGVTSGNRTSRTVLNDGTSYGGTRLLANDITFNTSVNAAGVATVLAAQIGTQGSIGAWVGGSAVTAACAAAASTSVCLVDTAAAGGGAGVTMGSLSNRGTLAFTTSAATAAVSAQYGPLAVDTTPLGAGGAVFVRTDIVPADNSYPKAPARTDCAGAACTYDEEMENFANWYAYYKTRNQMMKTAVGQAFKGITANYNVGIVALSVAAVEGPMTTPSEFSATKRSDWYRSLYAMTGTDATPLRPALHAIGKMYANQGNYRKPPGAEVIQYPCQQNFTFVTTDGYWNGKPATDVPSNDETENRDRFCLRGKGCVDGRSQTLNTLADVALYWYNGGSATGTASLRPELEPKDGSGALKVPPGENTHLHMTTYTLGLGVDGVMTYEPKYDTKPKDGGDFYNLITGAGSGCPWNGGGAYVWPDPNPTDEGTSIAYQSRVDDLWHAAINGHGKYFSASDPTQVVAGLAEALSNIEKKMGAASSAATSTPNITHEDNDLFASTFTTVDWYGELVDHKIDPVKGEVSPTATWSTSATLGRKVRADGDDRTIWMAGAGPNGLKPFRYQLSPAEQVANGGATGMTAQEKAWFDNKCNDLAQCALLSAADRITVNGGAAIVDWLRGQQRHADGNVLRAYAVTKDVPPGAATKLPIVLGDIASSTPAYVRDPRKDYAGDGYAEFRAAKAGRKAVVYVAANDGMLHAFDAANGDELWAYVPRITMRKLYKQASITYGGNHQYTADGSPEVGDVRIDGVWRTVLVAGLNAGGRGYYALDITDPARPKALWELCADAAVCNATDPDLGLSFGNPQFGTWKNAQGVETWAVFLTSGYNNVPGVEGVNSGDGKGYLYVIDAATGAKLAKIGTGNGDAQTPSGLARFTAITANPQTDPLVTYVYAGDNTGKMWRFDLTVPGAPAVLQMADAGSGQPITTAPEVALCAVATTAPDRTVTVGAERVVAFGTGRLLDVGDVGDDAGQSVYALRDSGRGVAAASWRDPAAMRPMTLSSNTVAGQSVYGIGGTTVDLSTHAGWYVDLDRNKGERVNLDPKIVAGTLNVVTNIPSSSSSCKVGGVSNVYQLDVCTGKARSSYAGHALSGSSAAVGYIVVQLQNGTFKGVATTADGANTTFDLPPGDSAAARKTGWRRVRD